MEIEKNPSTNNNKKTKARYLNERQETEKITSIKIS